MRSASETVRAHTRTAVAASQISLTNRGHGKYKIEIERNRKRTVTSRKSDVSRYEQCGGRHATGHPSSFPVFDSITIGNLFSVRGSAGQLSRTTPGRCFRYGRSGYAERRRNHH